MTALPGIPNPIRSCALARPEHPVLIDAKTRLTAKDLESAVRQQARRLSREGVQPGVRVGLLGRPSAEWAVACHCIGWLGAVVVPFSLDEPREQREAKAAALGLQYWLLLPDAQELAGVPNCIHWDPDAAAAACDQPELEERFWPLDETRLVIFTSGTEGRPEAVELSTSQLLFSAFGSAIRLGHIPEDRWLLCLPLHHIGGFSIIVRCALLGTTVLIHERFEAERVSRAIDCGEATLVSLVPTMLERILDVRGDAPFPDTLRALLVGGAPMPPALLRRCRKISAPVALTWGMSEAASQVATRFSGDLSDDSGGPPLPFARVEAGAGERLTIRGPLVADGLFCTSDVGHIDGGGGVHVHGRADDMIISGGEKIAPQEIEAILRAHPAVSDAAVIARHDRRWGQRPVAYIVPSNGHLQASELQSWCGQHLPSFKIPDEFSSCDELPRNAIGKLQRGRLTVSPERLLRELSSSEPTPPVDSVARETVARPFAASIADELSSLRAWLEVDLVRVEEVLRDLDRRSAIADRINVIERTLEGCEPNLAKQASHHLLTQTGKRLRPLCVLLASRLGEGAEESERARQVTQSTGVSAVCRAAVACELVHAATLLHDDVLDLGMRRRGAPAARLVFGNKASILGGDHLLTQSLRIVCALGLPDLMDELIDTIDEMVAAEALQLKQQKDLRLEPDIYFRIVRGKTAALFRWGLRAGARLGGLGSRGVAAAGHLGEQLGVAFQIVDDVLDLEGSEGELGKVPLADLHEGKLSWPILWAAQQQEEIARLLRVVATYQPDQHSELPYALDGKLSELRERVLASGAGAAGRRQASVFAEKARLAAETLPAVRARDALVTVVEYCLARLS